MSIEAMKQALEALELALRCHGVMLLSDPPQDAWKTYSVEPKSRDAITAIRTAIAEAEKQEPVATVYDAYDTTGIDWHCKDAPATGTKLYTSPPQREWQGLTYGEVLSLRKDDPLQFYKAIEAKLKEKNGL